MAIVSQDREDREYQSAERKLAAGDFAGAHAEFSALGDFKDAAARAGRIAGDHWQLVPGSVGSFGPCEWQVLDVEDGGSLLIAKDVIEKMRFDASSNVWAISELRTWLNVEFYGKFSKWERAAIAAAGDGDTATSDKVFLLSVDEAAYYFKGDADRAAKFEGGACGWWLRSPGAGGSGRAVYVKDSGGVYAAGGRVVYADRGVRPALWLNLTPEFFEAMAAQRASRAEWQRKKTRGLALHQEEIQDEESAGRLKVSRHAERAKAWKSQGLCRYCGGKLGIFSGKCKSCSRQN